MCDTYLTNLKKALKNNFVKISGNKVNILDFVNNIIKPINTKKYIINKFKNKDGKIKKYIDLFECDIILQTTTKKRRKKFLCLC